MSKFYQFEVTGISRKIDGKEYNTGDKFPFEPDNLRHKRILDLGMIKVVAAEPPKAKAPRKGTAKK